MKMKKLFTIIIAFFVMSLAFSNADNHKPNYTSEEVEFIQSLLDQGYTLLPEVYVFPSTQDTIKRFRNNRPMMRADVQRQPMQRQQMMNQRHPMNRQQMMAMNQRPMKKEQMMNQRPMHRHQMMNQRPMQKEQMKKMEQKKIQERKRDLTKCENPNPQPVRKMEQKKLQKRTK